MKTRSQTRQESSVNIDFDEASAAWKENKKSVGNGCYKYKCSSGLCKNVCSSPFTNVCKRHNKQNAMAKKSTQCAD